MPPQPVVVLSGALGSGKTTLARRLVQPLAATLLSKDLIKESMYEPLGLDDERRSKAGSIAAMRLMYDIAAASRSPLILEANWQAMDVAQLEALNHPDRTLFQLFCTAPAAVLKRRVLGRIESGERHPVHRDAMSAELLERITAPDVADAAPLALTCPVVHVDTTGDIDVSRLATRSSRPSADDTLGVRALSGSFA